MSQIAFYILSDVHGFIFPTDFSSRGKDLPMGLLKANHLIEQDCVHYDDSVKIDNGDFLQGSPLCNYLVSKLKSSLPLTSIYNRLGFDFGNNILLLTFITIDSTIVTGKVGIVNTISVININILSVFPPNNPADIPIPQANIIENTQPFTGQGIHYFKVNGLTIGTIGLTTQYIPHWEKPDYIKTLTFNSAFHTLKSELPTLREKSDIVVVSYHGGFERDLDSGIPTEALTGENEGYDILSQFSDSIDVLITGHQHRDIATIKNQTAIIQPGTKVGKIVIEYTHDKKVLIKECKLMNVHNNTSFKPNDEDIVLRNQLEDWLDTQIAELPYAMRINNSFEARKSPHAFVNLLNYILLEKSGADIACTALFDSANGFDEKVTMRDIINNYPFPNTFKVIELSGKDIKLAIERSASYFDIVNHKITVNKEFLEPKPQHFNYDIFAGIQYTIHVGHPYGERVSDLQINDAPLQSDQIYTICVNNYRAVGGGNYDMYVNKPVIKDIQIEGAQLLIDYLSHNDLSQIPQMLLSNPSFY